MERDPSRRAARRRSARDAGPGPAVRAARARMGAPAARAPRARSCARRATRSCMARFGLPALLPADDARPARVPRAGGAGAVRRARGPLDAPARAAAVGVVRARARAARPCRRLAGRARRAAAASPRRSRRRRARWACEIVTGHRVDVARRPARRPAPCCSTSRRARSSRSPATACPPGYRRQLERFRYGPGVFKIDWALDGPIPWRGPADARGPGPCTSAARCARSRRPRTPSAAAGIADRPFVLLVQPTIADPSRAPEGKHVAWAYCHVPNGSDRWT